MPLSSHPLQAFSAPTVKDGAVVLPARVSGAMTEFTLTPSVAHDLALALLTVVRPPRPRGTATDREPVTKPGGQLL